MTAAIIGNGNGCNADLLGSPSNFSPPSYWCFRNVLVGTWARRNMRRNRNCIGGATMTGRGPRALATGQGHDVGQCLRPRIRQGPVRAKKRCRANRSPDALRSGGRMPIDCRAKIVSEGEARGLRTRHGSATRHGWCRRGTASNATTRALTSRIHTKYPKPICTIS